MRKKIIRKSLAIVSLLALCLLTLCSCDESEEYVTAMKEHFVDKNTDLMIVKVNVEDSVASLQGEYTIAKQNEGFHVDYTYQKQNTFTVQDGVIVAPDEEISVMSGSATVVEGAVTEYSGDPLNIRFSRLNLSAFNFDVANFGEIEYDSEFVGFFQFSDIYKGEITNPKAFAGFDTTKMTFSAACGTNVEYSTFSLFYEDANDVSVAITYSVKLS